MADFRLSALYIGLFYTVFFLDFRDATAFIVKPVDTLVLAGDATQFNCTYNVAPYLKTWYRENSLIALREDIQDPYTGHYEIIGEGNVYNLRIHNTASDDGGEYECTDVGNRSKRAVAFLYVIDSITKCSVKNDTTVIAGDDVSFNCVIELDDNAPGDLVWYRDGEEVSRTCGHVNVWSTKLSKDDNGANFNCQLEHYTLPPSKWSELACEETIVMDVQYPPDIEITDKIGSTLVETTVEGDSYFANCKVDANPVDNLNVQWQYGHITVHDGALFELQNVNRNQGGLYNCIADNTFWDGTKGYKSYSIQIDVQYPPSVEGMSSATVVKEGESISFTCHVIDANPNDVEYLWILADGSEYGDAVVDIVNVTRELQGNQSCTATNTFYDRTHGIGSDIVYLEVQYTAVINMTVQPWHEVSEGSCISITCTVLNGNPDPYRLRLTLDKHELVEVDEFILMYKINRFETNDVGFYECQAFTLFFDGTEEYSVVGKDLKMKVPPSCSSTGTILFLVSLFVFVPIAALAGFLLSTFYWKRKLQDKANCTNNSTMDPKEEEYEHYTSISPRIKSESVYMKLEKQTSLEVSREFLFLKETLGEGVFGKVSKAVAWNIAGREGVTDVFVKILKEHHLDDDKRDFLRELDLLKSIGSHPYIVSLLGCCIEYEPFYIISEYMQGGNLQDYLRSNRNLQRAAYANTCSDVKTLTNNDLMTFAYQVSSGMEFLSSNGCIHRDLAARKVPLDKQNVCKISNFRLTREVDNKHQKECKIKSNLPVPWIALESIRDGIFTTKSNVWSFGVVLWEIVTMGNRPYPGMSKQEVTSSLQAGYRMPKPWHCEKELYSIILSCWDEDLEKRPTFAELSAILQKLTNDEETYIEITDIDLVDDN